MDEGLKDMEDEILKELVQKNNSRIVLLVMDGLGGLPINGKTELETARTPNLDRLTSKGSCGLSEPIGPGITPGSGPAHLSLFGYDPIKYQIGRGILEALGIGLELGPTDIAARGNFAQINEAGIILDRRAGRISTEKNRELCILLQKEISSPEDVQVSFKPVKEHRCVVILRGKDLAEGVSDTDPQREGERIKEAIPIIKEAEKTVNLINKLTQEINKVLNEESPANTILLRGISKIPHLPSFQEKYFLRSACIATYPMYRGLAKLVGMEIISTGETIKDEIETLKENFQNYDFFYLHIKKTDSYGEDGNFAKKVSIIEEVDTFIPEIEKLKPDVLVVTGDHSTPSLLKSHSWHPNPFLLLSKNCFPDKLSAFSETNCRQGSLGRFPATEAVALMLANALRLKKFGA